MLSFPVSIFNRITPTSIQTAHIIDTRKLLDRRVLIDLLNLPESILEPLDLLRLKWCSEPSVHGGKPTAPKSVR